MRTALVAVVALILWSCSDVVPTELEPEFSVGAAPGLYIIG